MYGSRRSAWALQSEQVTRGETAMKKAVFALLISALLCHGTATIAAVEYKIVTASARGTYIIIGRELAQFVASPAGIDLDALPSAGSAENVRRLRYEPGVKLA